MFKIWQISNIDFFQGSKKAEKESFKKIIIMCGSCIQVSYFALFRDKNVIAFSVFILRKS